MNKFPLIILFLMLKQFSFAQSAKAYEKSGDEAIRIEDYNAALEYFGEAIAQDSKNIGLTYKYAEAARLFNSYNLALDNYKKVVNSKESATYPLAKFWLGVMLKNTGDYKSAKATFQDLLLDTKKISDDLVAISKREEASCDWSIKTKSNPTKVTIVHLGKNINTPYSDFAAVDYRDSLYYSSLRFKNEDDNHNPPRLIAKILTTKDTLTAKPMKQVNAETQHTAYSTFDKRGRLIYASGKYSEDGSDITCTLYMRAPEGKSWSKPVRLPDFINVDGATATMPNIGRNKDGQEVLYYVSDRKDGKGKLDIWYSVLDKTGNFTYPINLAFLNTRSNDASPFFHNNTNTLYFSSDGMQTLGGYDIFSSQNQTKGWSEATNEGFPINSSYNDLYFSLNDNATDGYLSSNRLGSFFLDKKNETCCYDIYKLKFKEKKTPKEEPISPVVVTTDVPKKTDTTPKKTTQPNTPIKPNSNIPPLVSTTEKPKVGTSETPKTNPKDKTTDLTKIPDKGTTATTLEGFLPLPLYFDNDEPDKRTRNKTTLKTYTNTFDTYNAQKNKYITEATKGLEEQYKIEIEDNLNGFFDQNLKKNYADLQKFTPMLLGRLFKGEKIELIVKGYASTRAQSDYNLILSSRRVSSLVNYFKAYENGVFQKYFTNKQLTITQQTFGEDTASKKNLDDLTNEKVSIYSIDAMLERRIEIIEIKAL